MADDLVEVWVECVCCPQRSPSKYKERAYVEAAEAKGLKLRPALGMCPDCQQDMERIPQYGDGVYN